MTIRSAEEAGHGHVDHAYPEQRVDLGEVELNYAVAGDEAQPALLLIPGQTESWWGYESAMKRLEDRFRIYAVDLRGQGRSTWTPGRYTFDNFGNDLVRFIDRVIGRPTVVSGLSSGGVTAAWLSAYAMPGSVRGVLYEDPPLFSSAANSSCGQSLRQAIGPVFALWSKYLGDQWSIGDWKGMVEAGPKELPSHLAMLSPPFEEPPQNMLEYDPEWARAFWSGSVTASCDHEGMLRSVKVPVLMTHHFRTIHEETGCLLGALSDLQARRAGQLIQEAGQRFEYRSFPEMGHAMHMQDPDLYASVLREWVETLD